MRGPWKKFGKAFGFGPFGAPFMRDWMGEARTRRGDVKFQILEVIAERPRHGYDIIKELEERAGGMYRPSPGSVYPTLQMLEEGGYLTSEQESGKKVYTITAEGRQLLEQRPQEPAAGVDDFAPILAVKDSAMKLAGAVMQGIRAGDPRTSEQIKTILDKARREIYGLLADEEV